MMNIVFACVRVKMEGKKKRRNIVKKKEKKDGIQLSKESLQIATTPAMTQHNNVQG